MRHGSNPSSKLRAARSRSALASSAPARHQAWCVVHPVAAWRGTRRCVAEARQKRNAEPPRSTACRPASPTHRGFQVEAVHRIGEVVVVAGASYQLVGLGNAQWEEQRRGVSCDCTLESCALTHQVTLVCPGLQGGLAHAVAGHAQTARPRLPWRRSRVCGRPPPAWQVTRPVAGTISTTPGTWGATRTAPSTGCARRRPPQRLLQLQRSRL